MGPIFSEPPEFISFWHISWDELDQGGMWVELDQGFQQVSSCAQTLALSRIRNEGISTRTRFSPPPYVFAVYILRAGARKKIDFSACVKHFFSFQLEIEPWARTGHARTVAKKLFFGDGPCAVTGPRGGAGQSPNLTLAIVIHGPESPGSGSATPSRRPGPVDGPGVRAGGPDSV
jgi:hypothetical protein